MLTTLAALALLLRQPHDLVLENGTIVTLDPSKPVAQAVVARDGKILVVGSNKDVRAYESGANVIDLKGATVVPGMTDCHFHLPGVGEREMQLDLRGTNDYKKFLSKVKERVDAAKPGEWVEGDGWIETFWKPPVFPNLADLDKIAPRNPLVLYRVDGHALVANSLALAKAGVTKDTPSPAGGEISKDKSGRPTGMILDKAMAIFTPLIPQQSEAERDEAVIRGAEFAAAHGLCEIQVAGGLWPDVERLKRLFEAGKIKVRVYQAIYGPGPAAEKLIQDGPMMSLYGDRLTVRDIKIVADGALGSRGAWLLQPYSDKPDTSGFLRVKHAEVEPMLQEALRAGLQVETHAIGDATNRAILDWYDEAMKAVPPGQRKIAQPRWRVEHAQNISAPDIPRFSALGVIPSMQPSHAISDLHFAQRRLGMDRLSGAYAWKSLIDAGSIICGGSDAPVERGDPLIEFYAAVARKDLKGFYGPGWHPEQRLSREQALKLFTQWAAYAAFEEDRKGTIQVGKLADFTVFNRNIMKAPEAQIPTSKCLMTVVGGEVVYKAK